eukprot:jgi/Mesvir1/10673/Mv13765-RA.1
MRVSSMADSIKKNRLSCFAVACLPGKNEQPKTTKDGSKPRGSKTSKNPWAPTPPAVPAKKVMSGRREENGGVLPTLRVPVHANDFHVTAKCDLGGVALSPRSILLKTSGLKAGDKALHLQVRRAIADEVEALSTASVISEDFTEDKVAAAKAEEEDAALAKAQPVFVLLETYCANKRIRFYELLTQHDKRRVGRMTLTELKKLIQLVMPQVSDNQVRYIQTIVSPSLKGEVDIKEFSVLMKEYKNLGLEITAQESVDIKDVLKRLAVEMASNSNLAHTTFRTYGKDGNGTLSVVEQARMVRSMMPHLTEREHALVTRKLRLMSSHSDGSLMYKEIVAAVRTVSTKVSLSD